ncbi:hypothetical protein OEA41_008041 [Lepraria neglecta]|uniref:Heterokaryon incompatibility domain-containing protein n=1 Tax=Lepraria neglecta TaxID=209136 RepID=A0AAD9ZDU7_9LECA|nr:hypothetical protein OEA41_008041 [Lepraria neglecta]
MMKIYKKAAKVLIWFPAPTEETERAIVMIKAVEASVISGDEIGHEISKFRQDSQNLAENAHSSTLLQKMNYCVDRKIVGPLPKAGVDALIREWIAVANLFGDLYWTRVWVLQEMTCPVQQDVEVILGRQSQTLALRRFIMLVAIMVRPVAFKGGFPEGLGGADMEKVMRIALYEAWHLQTTFNIAISRIRRLPMFSLHQFRPEKDSPRMTALEGDLWRHDLLPTLEVKRVQEGKDPRNKLYAAFDITLESSDPAFKADYAASVPEVYSKPTIVVPRLEDRARHRASFDLLNSSGGPIYQSSDREYVSTGETLWQAYFRTLVADHQEIRGIISSMGKERPPRWPQEPRDEIPEWWHSSDTSKPQLWLSDIFSRNFTPESQQLICKRGTDLAWTKQSTDSGVEISNEEAYQELPQAMPREQFTENFTNYLRSASLGRVTKGRILCLTDTGHMELQNPFNYYPIALKLQTPRAYYSMEKKSIYLSIPFSTITDSLSYRIPNTFYMLHLHSFGSRLSTSQLQEAYLASYNKIEARINKGEGAIFPLQVRVNWGPVSILFWQNMFTKHQACFSDILLIFKALEFVTIFDEETTARFAYSRAYSYKIEWIKDPTHSESVDQGRIFGEPVAGSQLNGTYVNASSGDVNSE